MDAIARRDIAVASRLFRQIADSGEWQGHYMLAVLALESTGDSRLRDALVHMDTAALAGHTAALLGLAILLLCTTETVQRKRAMVILRRLVDEDDDLSRIVLGLALSNEELATASADATVESLWTVAAQKDWVWAMQLLASRNLAKGRVSAALKWKWRAFATTLRLAKIDPADARLINAS